MSPGSLSFYTSLEASNTIALLGALNIMKWCHDLGQLEAPGAALYVSKTGGGINYNVLLKVEYIVYSS
jgi:hypothetical protein